MISADLRLSQSRTIDSMDFTSALAQIASSVLWSLITTIGSILFVFLAAFVFLYPDSDEGEPPRLISRARRSSVSSKIQFPKAFSSEFDTRTQMLITLHNTILYNDLERFHTDLERYLLSEPDQEQIENVRSLIKSTRSHLLTQFVAATSESQGASPRRGEFSAK